MGSPVSPFHSGEDDFDHSKPFLGVVVCCTSIAPEQRSEIAKKTTELGGIHKYDLTPDVTHLIVGAYDTPKYRHVAKERPDIKPMTVGWVDAVITRWQDGAEIDMDALEQEYRLLPLETGTEAEASFQDTAVPRGRLLCCLTGFNDTEERKAIIEEIENNGGAYTGDLSREVTHLIVSKPEGRKYTAAKSWNIYTVAVEWLHGSVARTMILDENAYDPLLPPEERGKGAWVRKSVKRTSLGKRHREARAANEEGARKLRKTASMKLKSQRENLWGDILSRQPSFNQSAPKNESEEPQRGETDEGHASVPAVGEKKPETAAGPIDAPSGSGVFSSCCFYVHGFSTSRTSRTIDTLMQMGGKVVWSLEEMSSIDIQTHYANLIMVVSQDSQPQDHPALFDGLQIVTEFYIERCLFGKTFLQPGEHVIGQPFPVFPIQGFEEISICTSGFTGVDLHHIDRAICQLGAKYQERFTPDTSMLLCTSLGTMRRQKLQLALNWGVPVLDVKWLWECISTGFRVPMEGFLFQKLKQRGPFAWKRARPEGTTTQSRPGSRSGKTEGRTKSESTLGQSRPVSRSKPGAEQMSRSKSIPAADPTPTVGSLPPTEPSFLREEEPVLVTAPFETAPTHQPSTSKESSRPLSEASASSLNKPAPSARAPSQQGPRKPLARIYSEVADSEAAGDSDYARESAEPESAETRHEREKREAAAAERAVLTTRLGSLLQSNASGKSTEEKTSSEPVPAAVTAAPSEDKQAGRRHRSIMGRAASNVSAASAGSHESNKVAVRVGDGTQAERSELPAQSTQLEYEDPAARRQKAQLLSKLAGSADRPGTGECPDGSAEVKTVGRNIARAPAVGVRKMRSGRTTRKGFC